MSTDGLHRRRRLAAAGVLAALLVVVVAVVRSCGEQAPPPRATSLLDALAPVLGTGAGRPAARGEGDLGVPLDRAAAQLFLVGYGEARPFLRRLRVRDWGGVVVRDRDVSRSVRRVARAAGHTPPLVLGPGGDARLGPSFDLAYAAGPHADDGLPEDPAAAAEAARRAVRRLRAAGIEAIPGHFPGEGAASTDPSLAPAAVGLGLEELRAADLRPFAAAAPDVRAVQLSAALYVGFDAVTPATLLPEVVRLLREVDPDALAVSADLQQVALATARPVAAVAIEALRAGCDVLHVPGDAADQEQAFRAVVRAMRTGELPRGRVQDALSRVATFKRRAGVVGPGSG